MSLKEIKRNFSTIIQLNKINKISLRKIAFQYGYDFNRLRNQLRCFNKGRYNPLIMREDGLRSIIRKKKELISVWEYFKIKIGYHPARAYDRFLKAVENGAIPSKLLLGHHAMKMRHNKRDLYFVKGSALEEIFKLSQNWR